MIPNYLKISHIIFFLSLTTSAFSQETISHKPISNRLELIYPNYYYFDKRFRVSLPVANIGAKYSRYKEEKNRGFQITLSTDFMHDFSDADKFGDIVGRWILYPSFGIFSNLVRRPNFEINYYGELNHRLGQINWTGGSGGWELNISSYDLIDFGVSIGSNTSFSIKNKLVFSLDVKQTFYYYRFDKGYEPYNIKGSPRNVLTFYFGVGWKF